MRRYVQHAVANANVDVLRSLIPKKVDNRYYMFRNMIVYDICILSARIDVASIIYKQPTPAELFMQLPLIQDIDPFDIAAHYESNPHLEAMINSTSRRKFLSYLRSKLRENEMEIYMSLANSPYAKNSNVSKLLLIAADAFTSFGLLETAKPLIDCAEHTRIETTAMEMVEPNELLLIESFVSDNIIALSPDAASKLKYMNDLKDKLGIRYIQHSFGPVQNGLVAVTFDRCKSYKTDSIKRLFTKQPNRIFAMLIYLWLFGIRAKPNHLKIDADGHLAIWCEVKGYTLSKPGSILTGADDIDEELIMYVKTKPKKAWTVIEAFKKEMSNVLPQCTILNGIPNIRKFIELYVYDPTNS